MPLGRVVGIANQERLLGIANQERLLESAYGVQACLPERLLQDDHQFDTAVLIRALVVFKGSYKDDFTWLLLQTSP